MLAMERFNRLPWAAQVERIAAFCRQFGSPLVRVDATGVGDPIVEALAARGLRVEPYRFTHQSKATAVDNLALLLSRGEVAILDDPVLLGELRSYEFQQLPGGGVRTSAPHGMNDDAVMALALAVLPAARPKEWVLF